MATVYNVEKVISGSGHRMMVTVRFGGRTLTRHIVGGVGRHPDDSLPRRYRKVQENINEVRARVVLLTKGIEEAEAAVAKGGPQRNIAADVLPLMRQRKLVTEAALATMVQAFDEVQAENPPMVNYTAAAIAAAA